MCCDVGILQAYLDQELDLRQVKEVEAHLADCEECRRVLGELQENSSFVDARLDPYIEALDEADIEVNAAWKRFSKNYMPEPKKRFSLREVFRSMRKYKFAAAACAMVLVLTASLSFNSVRSFAGELLTVFRVENVQTININPQEMTEMQKAIEKGAGEVDIDNFGKIEVSGGNNTSEVVTMEEAQQAVDFTVKLPAELPGGYKDPEVQKSTGNTASFTLNVGNVNALLSSLGSSKYLPEELDGKTFVLRMPVAIGAKYTDDSGNRLIVGQSRSPEMVAPEGVRVDELRDALLAIPVLPESLKKQLLAINDWEHTILIPNIEGSSREVSVNGVQGVFMSVPDNSSNSGAALIWQEDGVVYMLGGEKLTLEQAQAIAGSMR